MPGVTSNADGELMNAVVIGAGISGVGAAVRLRQLGIERIALLERGTEIGGQWRDAGYPGAVNDTPSVLYSYTFAPDRNTHSLFGTRRSTLRYLRSLVSDHGLDGIVRFEQLVTGLQYDPIAMEWEIRVQHKPVFRARNVILATGVAAQDRLPRLPGIDLFDGPILHTADWHGDLELTDRTVGIISAGASSVHLVPEIVRRAKRVKVFLRSADWVLPRPTGALEDVYSAVGLNAPTLSMRAVERASSAISLGSYGRTATNAVETLSRRYLRRHIEDPWLRRSLRPDYRAGSRRLLFSNDFYQAIASPKCQLIPWPVASLTSVGVNTADAMRHRVDIVMFATDLSPTNIEPPFPVTGLDGQSLGVRLAEAGSAHNGLNLPGFPGLFLLGGPGSGVAGLGGLAHTDAQISYVAKALRLQVDGAIGSLEISDAALRRQQHEATQRMRHTLWSDGAPRWYLPRSRIELELYPGRADEFQLQLDDVTLRDFVVTTAAQENPAIS